jgi:hypothetical protein
MAIIPDNYVDEQRVNKNVSAFFKRYNMSQTSKIPAGIRFDGNNI